MFSRKQRITLKFMETVFCNPIASCWQCLWKYYMNAESTTAPGLLTQLFPKFWLLISKVHKLEARDSLLWWEEILTTLSSDALSPSASTIEALQISCSGFWVLCSFPSPYNHALVASSSTYNCSFVLTLQVVTLLTSLLKLEPPDHVCLTVLDFLSSLSRLFIPSAIQVIHSLTKMQNLKTLSND